MNRSCPVLAHVHISFSKHTVRAIDPDSPLKLLCAGLLTTCFSTHADMIYGSLPFGKTAVRHQTFGPSGAGVVRRCVPPLQQCGNVCEG